MSRICSYYKYIYIYIYIYSTKQINVYTSKLMTILQRLLNEEVLIVEILIAALVLLLDVLLF